MIDNPFVQVWNALWEMAERNSVLMELIRPGNRIKYDSILDNKPAVSDSDLPELALLSSGGTSNVMNSSSTSSMNREYTWAITTAEFNLNAKYNIISWELYRAMINWDKVLCALQWPDGWNFVVRTNLISIEEGTLMTDLNRGIRGWSGMWRIDVEMHFQTSSLRLE